ncbi:MAG: hypothetical protein ACI81V_000151 [Lentimonas sp.]|jgi:hypothetical protein
MFYGGHGEDALMKKLRTEPSLASPYRPALAEAKYPYSTFGIVVGGTYFDISMYYRESVGGKDYEFWTIQTSYEPIRQKNDVTHFFFCETDGFYEKRVIKMETDDFKSHHLFEDGHHFARPIHDKDFIRRLKPEAFKSSYRSERLWDRKVE